MHCWYSNQHDLKCGVATYMMDGEPKAVTFVCASLEKGWQYIKEQLSHFTDYIYIGLGQEFICESRPSCTEVLHRAK